MNYLKKFEEIKWINNLIKSAKPSEVGREPIYGSKNKLPSQTTGNVNNTSNTTNQQSKIDITQIVVSFINGIRWNTNC